MISWFIVFSACRPCRPLSLSLFRHGRACPGHLADEGSALIGMRAPSGARMTLVLLGRLGQSALAALLLGVVQVDIECERAHLDLHPVAPFRSSGLERVVAADDRLV